MIPKQLFWIGFFTLVGFGLAGFAMVTFFQDRSFEEVLVSGKPLWVQFLVGILAGLGSALLAIFVISRAFFEKERNYYKNLINSFNWSPVAILFVSFCAGVGEEVFFRAGLQPLLGIWWTSIVFVALHGYLNPLNWKITVYGVLMVGVIACFGYLFQFVGLWAAIVSHSVFDLILIGWMTCCR